MLPLPSSLLLSLVLALLPADLVSAQLPILRGGGFGGSTADNVNRLITLPYATYKGFFDGTANMNKYLGVRYAASADGENRWRAAQEPEVVAQVQNATTLPVQCIQAGSDASTVQSEDCLFLNVYTPANRTAPLPVMVFIHGGAYLAGSASSYDPTPLINAAGNAFMAVIIQYRLGAYGFLQSSDINSSGGTNAGLTDAAFALQWVAKYISRFGGDPNRVTVWGQSAGGTSALSLATAEYGRDRRLFESVIGSSPWTPAVTSCSSSYFSTQYSNFLKATGCTDLACLRSASTATLRSANNVLSSQTQTGYAIAFFTCIEASGGYLTKTVTQSLLAGEVAGNYTIVGNNARDGFNFVPSELTNDQTGATADAVLSAVLAIGWPLSSSGVSSILAAYPLSSFANQVDRAIVLIQDSFFVCASTWMAEAYPAGHAYRYLFGVGAATHAYELGYDFPLNFGSLKSPSFQLSWFESFTSFLSSTPSSAASPNTFNSLVASGKEPSWPTYESGSSQFKLFNVSSATNASDISIGSGDNVVRVGLKSRCDLWASLRKDGGW